MGEKKVNDLQLLFFSFTSILYVFGKKKKTHTQNHCKRDTEKKTNWIDFIFFLFFAVIDCKQKRNEMKKNFVVCIHMIEIEIDDSKWK